MSFDESLSYYLGVMKGDGSAYITHDGRGVERYCIQLQTKDEAFAKSFQETLREFGIHREIVNKKYYAGMQKSRPRNSYFIHHYRQEPFYLFKVALWDTEEVRRFVMQGSENMKHFLRGIYESEGGYYKNAGSGGDYLNVFTGANFDLGNLVKDCLIELGYNPMVGIHKQSEKSPGTKDMMAVRIGVPSAPSFLDLINPCIKRPNFQQGVLV